MFLRLWIVQITALLVAHPWGTNSPAGWLCARQPTTDWIPLPDNPAILLSRGHTAVPRARFIPFVFSSLLDIPFYQCSKFTSDPFRIPFFPNNVSTRRVTTVETIHLMMSFITGCKQLYERMKYLFT